MARRLGDELNELRFQDNLSGSEIVLLYRMPTTKERVAYTNESYQRKGRKVINRTVETRMKFGLAILGGFREGDFERQVGGKYVPMSSDSASDNYFPEWKEHIEKYASDLVEHLALRVFDMPVQIPEEDEGTTDDGRGATGEEDLDPTV
ncbi:MAG: hypothetical protein JRE58_02345 [Deltaproteobacteria bacterium]|nr:hypothetical protein [Deltaproteobacteria bacterium]